MSQRPTYSTLSDTLVPYTTLCRSAVMSMVVGAGAAACASVAPVCRPAERATASSSGLSPLPLRNEDAVIGGFLRSTGHDAIDDGATRWGAGAMSLCHRAVATVSWNKTGGNASTEPRSSGGGSVTTCDAARSTRQDRKSVV